MSDLDGQVVLVTGASRGIGLGISCGLARAGAQVVMNYRSDAQRASAVFQNGVAVSARSGHKDAAFKWLNYLTTSEQSVTSRISSSWELPPLADASKLSGYLDIKPPANRQAVMDALGKQSLQPVVAKQQQMQDIVDKALTQAAGGADLQKTLDDAAQQVTALL